MAGELWTALEQENANNIRKWLYGTVLVRDWDPAGSTSLAGFSPFATGGNLVTTLMSPNNPGGQWYDVGYLDENGVEFTPKYATEDTNVWQTRWPVRADASKDGEEIMITCAETNPVVDCLFNNLALSNLASLSVGETGYQTTTPTTPTIRYRQMMIIGVDASLSSAIYVVEIRPKVSLVKKEKRQLNAKKPDTFGLSYEAYIDQASGYAQTHLYGGPGWTAIGGSPVFATPDLISLSPPVVNTAAIVPSTLAGTPSTTGGTLAAGTYFWSMTATTAAGESIVGNQISATTTGSTSSNVLTWTAVTGATGYKIYRGASFLTVNTLVTTIGSGATVTYTDTGSAGTSVSPPAVNGAVLPAPAAPSAGNSGASGGVLSANTQIYYWVVTALTANGETVASSEVSLDPTGTSAALAWTLVTGATGYRVYRGLTSGGENVLAAQLPAGANTFIDNGTAVEAVALTSHQVQLQWQQPASNNGPFSYSITQTTGGSTAAVTIVSAPATGATGLVTATVGSLTGSNVYTFTVTVAAADGNTVSYPASNSITST